MKKLSLFLCGALVTASCMAQDPHFSQYYASQATVNPANTGMFTGNTRVSGLYRQQWPQYGSPFVTGTIAFETKPRAFQDGNNPNRLAFGALLMYDKTPDQVLKGQHAYLTLAYHKALDPDGHSRLGLGFMGGYNQRSLDPTYLTYGTQFQSGGFNTNRPGEAIAFKTMSSFDLHTGLLYSYEDVDRLFYAGASVYHLLNPKTYYLGSGDVETTLPKRFNINAGMNISNGSYHYVASMLLMQQAKVNEAMVGGAIGIPFAEDEGVFYAGAWYRIGEAIIPTINLQYKSMNLGLSYDTYVDNKKTMVKPRSFELSLAVRYAPVYDPTACFAF
jgi:type IX secretion system PorP/SprF family membrane protein